MQLDRVTLEHVRDVSRREGRTQAEALRILVAEAVRHRHHTGTAHATVPAEDESSEMQAGVVGAHVPGTMRYAIADLATSEGRSVSSMTKCLLREALRARGVLKAAGNDQR